MEPLLNHENYLDARNVPANFELLTFEYDQQSPILVPQILNDIPEQVKPLLTDDLIKAVEAVTYIAEHTAIEDEARKV